MMMATDEVRVPAFPPSANRLAAIANREDFSLTELTNVVRADEVLAATAVRYANSAAMARRGSVASIDEAVGRLGAKQIVRLAFAAGIGREAMTTGSLRRLRRRVWREGLFSAELCRELAGGRGVRPEVAFTSGLLHDFGKVVALGCLETILKATPGARVSEERCSHVVELYHVELGVLVATRWNLGAELIESIGHHHVPPQPGSLNELLTVVDRLVSSHGAGEADRYGVGLTASEWQAVQPLLRSLPKLLTSLEAAMVSETQRASRPSGVLLRPATCLSCEGIDAEVHVTMGGERHLASHAAVDGVRLVTDALLDEESLLYVEIEVGDRSAGLWCVVARSVPSGDRREVELTPASLDELTRQRWREVIGAAA